MAAKKAKMEKKLRSPKSELDIWKVNVNDENQSVKTDNKARRKSSGHRTRLRFC